MRRFAFMVLLVLYASSTHAADHAFTGLPLDNDGWTDLTMLVQDDSRIVYVSSSNGNNETATIYDSTSFLDIFNPGSPAAYATLSAAYDQLRDGYPDIMLLKRGDSWTSNLPNWEKSGASPLRRMILSAYGPVSEERPITGRFNCNTTVNFLIISSLELDRDERAFNWEGGANHILIEDIYSPPGLNHGMCMQYPGVDGGIDYLAIRRCVIAGRYRPAGSGTYVQGIYIDDSINLLIEENVFDQNGWEYGGGENNAADLRSHNTYIMLGRDSTQQHIMRYNVSTRGRSHGLQAGSGGQIHANLCVQDAIAIQASREDTWWDNGYSADIKHNVILHGRDANSHERRGWGIVIANSHDATVEDNIIGSNDESGQPFGIVLRANNRSGTQMYIRNLAIKDNVIHNWNGSDIIDGESISIASANFSDGTIYTHGSDPEDYVTGISISGNKLHSTNSALRVIQTDFPADIVSSDGNTFFTTRSSGEWFRMSAPEYDIDGYQTLVGDSTSTAAETTPSGDYGITDYLASINETATLESFYVNLRAQRKGAWKPDYTAVAVINYVREKFSLDAIEKEYAEDSNPDPEVPDDDPSPDAPANRSDGSGGGCFILRSF